MLPSDSSVTQSIQSMLSPSLRGPTKAQTYSPFNPTELDWTCQENGMNCLNPGVRVCRNVKCCKKYWPSVSECT